MRTRYEPPHAGVPGETPTPVAVSFARVTPSAVVPWVLGEAAANSMPPVAVPDEDAIAHWREQARVEGLALGREQAEAELAATQTQLADDVRASLASVAELRASLVESYRSELADLAIAVAEAVIQRELGDGRAVLEGFLQQALVEMDPHERCTITVGSADAAAITDWARERWPAALVREDGALRPGELRVEAKSGRIEVDHAERMARVRRLVLGEREPS